jgi:hypothetical protein
VENGNNAEVWTPPPPPTFNGKEVRDIIMIAVADAQIFLFLLNIKTRDSRSLGIIIRI